jgi:hypothetical protein
MKAEKGLELYTNKSVVIFLFEFSHRILDHESKSLYQFKWVQQKQMPKQYC